MTFSLRMNLAGPLLVTLLAAAQLLGWAPTAAAQHAPVRALDTGAVDARPVVMRTLDARPAVTLKVAHALDDLRHAWFDELDALTATTRELAVADDTYEFVARPNIPYVDAHYARESLAASRISTVLIINRRGQPLFWRRGNLGAGNGFADAKAFLAELPQLASAGAPGVPSLVGAVQLVQGASLVVAMPIYAGSGTGVSRGWLIIVRPLDAAQWHRYEEGAHIPTEVLDPASSTLPADIETALRKPLTAYVQVEGSHIRGLMAVPDIDGKPLRLFSVVAAVPPIIVVKPPAPESFARRWVWLWIWLAPAAIFGCVVGYAFWGLRRRRRLGAARSTAATLAPAPEGQIGGSTAAQDLGEEPGIDAGMHLAADGAAVRREELHARIIEMNLDFRYQPQIDLRTGRVAGVESQLAHPEFVADVEAAGLGFQLAQRWIQEACRNQRIWLQHVGHEFPVSVPVSQRTLEDPHFLPFLSRTLARYELAPQFLELECPEWILGGSAAGLRAISDAHAAGFCIAIDRYNAARSNLRLLTVVPVGKLRIDPALVRKIGSATPEAALFDGIIGAARGLGIVVCATGVDSQELVAATLRHGRPLAQGEALARAINADEFLIYLGGSATDTASLPPLQLDDAVPQP
jgi:EAL domain-containing protein (putative c-di-GMP-specific phosphodiesterase class I)/sensor domain CHASE-containing protein